MSARSQIIDLSQVEGPVFTGRDRGEALRQRYALEQLERDFDVIDVVIPEGTYSVSSSFFLGMFGPSVLKCGSVDSFQEKYHFKAAGFLQPVLREHAAKALQNKTLFS